MHPTESDRPLIVYLDIKSPYAYLAWQPTRDMAAKLGIQVDWRPFVLDIPSYLGSAKLDKRGKVASADRSAQQWSGVKYSYFDCRRYANLREITVRGTVKIWNTDLTAIGWLWAKRQGDEVLENYIQTLYVPFWKRELDAEDLDVIEQALVTAGADTDGFREYAAGEGADENRTLQETAFDAGIFGVPTFIVDGERYFGREHLPRIEWQLQGSKGVSPVRGYESSGTVPVEPVPEGPLEVCIDFRCPESLGAVADSLALAEETGRSLHWLPKQRLLPPLPGDPSDNSRGARHRRFRYDYERADALRYGVLPFSEPFPDWDCELLDHTLLWLNEVRPDSATAYVRAVFAALWEEGRKLENLEEVVGLLDEIGAGGDGLADFLAAGPTRLADAEQQLRERRVMGTPCWLLDGEPFVGRHHLPLIRARLTA